MMGSAQAPMFAQIGDASAGLAMRTRGGVMFGALVRTLTAERRPPTRLVVVLEPPSIMNGPRRSTAMPGGHSMMRATVHSVHRLGAGLVIRSSWLGGRVSAEGRAVGGSARWI